MERLTTGRILFPLRSVCVSVCLSVFFSHCVSSGFGDRNKKNGNYPRVQELSIMNVKGKEMK